MSESEYLRLSLKHLKEAEKLLEKKDYSQAYEKLQGTFVEAVKAVAVEQDISLGTHRSIAESYLSFTEKVPAQRSARYAAGYGIFDLLYKSMLLEQTHACSQRT
ncbi:MAG: HEPN domain-containing protein [Candidatus Brockarchaeota archaeon]|nr:HEPN domain-containing protein [Candidatus Brockarchaeota archaeon]